MYIFFIFLSILVDCIVPGIMARALYLSYPYQLFLQYYLILDAFPTKQDLLKKKKKKKGNVLC